MQRRLSSAIGERKIRPLYAARGNFTFRGTRFPFLPRCEIAPAPGDCRFAPYRSDRSREIVLKRTDYRSRSYASIIRCLLDGMSKRKTKNGERGLMRTTVDLYAPAFATGNLSDDG